MSDTEHLVGHFCFHFLTIALSNITWLSMTLSRKYRVRRKLFYLAHPVSQPPTGREYRKTWKSVIQNKQPSWSPVAGHTEARGLKLPLWYSFPNRIHHCKSKSLHIPYPSIFICYCWHWQRSFNTFGESIPLQEAFLPLSLTLFYCIIIYFFSDFFRFSSRMGGGNDLKQILEE